MRSPSVNPGETYGSLYVLEFDGLRHTGKQRHRYFKCRCSCGTVASVQGRLLKSGNSTSCGCKLKSYRQKIKGVPQCKIEVGTVFSRLTLQKWLYTKNKCAICAFKCACGVEVILPLGDIKSGRTRSCGCLRREKASKMGQHKTSAQLIKMAFTKSKHPGLDSARRLMRNYAWDAKKRNLSFEICETDFLKLTKFQCFYCGQSPSKTIKGRQKYAKSDYVYNGLDRINNKIGYTLNNVVPCCHNCNCAKRTMTYTEFIAWAKRLAANLPVLEATDRYSSAS